MIRLGYCTLNQWFISVAFPPPSGLRDNMCIHNITYRWYCSSSWLNILSLMFNDLCLSSHLTIPMSFALDACQLCKISVAIITHIPVKEKGSHIPNKDHTFFWLLVKNIHFYRNNKTPLQGFFPQFGSHVI